MLPACYKVNSTSAACVKMCRIAFRIRIYSHQYALMLTFSLEYALLICEHNRIKSAIIERLAVLLRVLKLAYKLCQLIPLRSIVGLPQCRVAILNIMLNVTDGLVVYPKVVRSRLMAELPFMASENIMMQAVEKGGNRQELHERLRQHAIAAGKQVKEEGLPNDMVDRIAADPAFGLTKEEITAGLVPENFVGRAPQQVEEFIAHILKPIFDANPDAVEQHANLSV